MGVKEEAIAKARELREQADRMWEYGDKAGSDRVHREARALEDRAGLEGVRERSARRKAQILEARRHLDRMWEEGGEPVSRVADALREVLDLLDDMIANG